MKRITKSIVTTALTGLVYILPAAAQFTVHPGTGVRVGQEVLFDASGSVASSSLSSSVFDWDFGNGYEFKDGVSCTHFFMKPGTFTVKLTVNGAVKGQKTITVTGTEPLRRFELRHAPFHVRTAQYITVRLPTSVFREPTSSMKVVLTSDKGYNKILVNKSALASEEKFLLENAKLPKGNYTLTVILADASGTQLSELVETFPKDYDGAPRTGINENNALVVDGKPFFPVTCWILDKDKMGSWKDKGYINSLYGIGWYKSYDLGVWKDYLNQGTANGWEVIGPAGKWSGNHGRNADLGSLADYVNQTKDHSSLLMWMWDDEPNMQPRDKTIPAPTLRSWTYKTNRLDPQRPVCTNLMGKDYLPYYGGGAADDWNYLTNGELFGGRRTFPCDIIGFDLYPMEQQNDPFLSGSVTGSEMADYASAIDWMVKKNLDLIPAMSFIEVCDIFANSTPAPSSEQVLMETWLNVVHGVKGISWFHYFQQNTVRWDAMAAFYDQIGRLGEIVLGPEAATEVTDNADVKGNRVDILVREEGRDLYVFAVRLTEIPEQNAPDINVTFTVTGGKNGTAAVIDEGRSRTVTGGVFTDTFAPNDVHIYKIAGGAAGIADPRPAGRQPVLPGTVPAGYYAMDGRRVENPAAAGIYVAVDRNGSVIRRMVVTP